MDYNACLKDARGEIMKALAWIVGALVAYQSPVFAFTNPPKEDPASRQPAAPQFMEKPLPELKGVVSWKTLAEVTPVKQNDKFVPSFSRSIAQLDKKEVKLQGFMMPLEMGERQKNFILTSTPPGCAFCLPGGPDALVEVQARAPIKYGFDPVVLSGKFSVLKDDPMGLYYRLTDAVPVAVK
jgi:hypothetical protein